MTPRANTATADIPVQVLKVHHGTMTTMMMTAGTIPDPAMTVGTGIPTVRGIPAVPGIRGVPTGIPIGDKKLNG